jgi:DNA adenine methylase
MSQSPMADAKPFIKWAGGKRQLLNKLLSKVPSNATIYHEFFLGGGALFFELYNQGRIKKAVLSDINPLLMNAYSVVKENPAELLQELKKKKYSNTTEAFYSIREWEPTNSIEKASRFIYLNKTAFNGLYRENKSGKFNVPFGKYTNPRIVDEQNIEAVSKALKNAKLLCGDFSEITKHAKKGDFAYFDPPYFPLKDKASFTSYHSSNFILSDQQRLKKTFDELNKKGVNVLLSNSNTDVIANLFSDNQQQEVHASRMINCKAEKRGPVKELLISSGYS